MFSILNHLWAGLRRICLTGRWFRFISNYVSCVLVGPIAFSRIRPGRFCDRSIIRDLCFSVCVLPHVLRYHIYVARDAIQVSGAVVMDPFVWEVCRLNDLQGKE